MANFFSSSTKKEVLQTPEEAAARKSLSDTIAAGTPNLPRQEIAGASVDQVNWQNMTRDYANSEPEGLDYFKQVMGQSDDILQNPAYKALFDKVSAAGERETNRAGRSLQLRGGTSSGAGQDALGRTVAQNQSDLLATLAPYQQAQQNAKMTAAQSLSQLGESSTLNRLAALGQSGDFTQRLDQLNKDSDYARKMAMTVWPWEQGAQVANTLLANKADWSVTQSPSMFSQIASPVAELIGGVGSAMKKGATAGAA
jgi:hypothetical protein